MKGVQGAGVGHGRCSVLLTSWVHGHLLPCRPALLTLLPLGGHDIADKNNVTGASRLQRDGVHPEVLEHIENGLEPQVLDPALTLLVQRQAQVLGLALEVESEDVLAPPRLALPYQENTMGAGTSRQH